MGNEQDLGFGKSSQYQARAKSKKKVAEMEFSLVRSGSEIECLGVSRKWGTRLSGGGWKWKWRLAQRAGRAVWGPPRASLQWLDNDVVSRPVTASRLDLRKLYLEPQPDIENRRHSMPFRMMGTPLNLLVEYLYPCNWLDRF